MKLNTYVITFLILISLVTLTFCKHSNKTNTNNKPLKPALFDLEFLNHLNGKSPTEVKLFENQAFKKHLKKLIGTQFNLLIEAWNLETPIEVNNNIFVSEGCRTHACDYTNFIIVVDLTKHIMHVGIKKEGNIKIYSEDGSKSQRIYEWAKNN